MQAHRLSNKGVGHFPRKMDLIMNFRENLKKPAPHHIQNKSSNNKQKKKQNKTTQTNTKQKHNKKTHTKNNKINHNPEAIKLKLQTPLEYPISILAPTF